ncbi:MAG: hypothetical protein AAF297_05790 [Planctomycetota bacterium]
MHATRWAALLILASTAACSAQPGPDTPLRTNMPGLEDTQPDARFGIADADALLERLEVARSEIDTLTASLTYRREFAIAGDTQTRLGDLYFDNDADRAEGEADARTRFAVRFDRLIVGDRLERQDQLFVFDGEWLVEKVASDRRFTKRQVAPPGSTFDPLRIGEGPFPVPLGQRPADIVARYNAELRPATEGLRDAALAEFAEANLVQLRLTPKPEYEDTDDFTEIRLWYDPQTPAMLPKIARTETAIGDVSLVVVARAELNQDLPADVFDTSTPPRGEGWNVTVSAYRAPVRTNAPVPGGTEAAP